MVTGASGGVKPGSVVELERRLYQQLLVGRQKLASIYDEPDTDLEAMAFKLEVEREALFARLERQQQAREVFLAVSGQLSEVVIKEVAHNLTDVDYLLKRVSMTPTQLALFEELCLDAPNLGRLRLLISAEPWLSRDLLNLVNSAGFRNRQQRSDVQVSDIKLALNFIGIQSLRQLIPYYCMRHWLPSGHLCLLWTNRKLWQFAFSSAIAASALAKLHNRNETLAFIGALLQQFGIILVLGAAADSYEKNWGHWLREASSSRDKELYDAVMLTEFPAARIVDEVMRHAGHLAWDIPSRLDFSEHPLVEMIKTLNTTLSVSELPQDVQIQARASCFATILTLQQAKQLEPQDARLLLRYYGFSEQEVLRLKAQNYKQFTLS